MNIKHKAINKLTNFLNYIAEGDEGLKRELEEVGPIRIIKTFIVLQVLTVLTLVLVVAL